MCTRTRIKHVYQGVQGACPWQAVTSAGVMAEHCDVGMGLKLVVLRIKICKWDKFQEQFNFSVWDQENVLF